TVVVFCVGFAQGVVCARSPAGRVVLGTAAQGLTMVRECSAGGRAQHAQVGRRSVGARQGREARERTTVRVASSTLPHQRRLRPRAVAPHVTVLLLLYAQLPLLALRVMHALRA